VKKKKKKKKEEALSSDGSSRSLYLSSLPEYTRSDASAEFGSSFLLRLAWNG
jgi:hypothetical protein